MKIHKAMQGTSFQFLWAPGPHMNHMAGKM